MSAEGNGIAISATSQGGRDFLLTPKMLFGVSLSLGLSCHNTHPELHMEFGTGRCYTSISHGLPGTGSYRGDQILLLSAVIPPSSSGTGHLGFANPGPGLEQGLNTGAPVQPLPQNPPTTSVEKRAVNQPTPTCLSGLPCHFPLDISIILLCLQLRTSTKRLLLSSLLRSTEQQSCTGTDSC